MAIVILLLKILLAIVLLGCGLYLYQFFIYLGKYNRWYKGGCRVSLFDRQLFEDWEESYRIIAEKVSAYKGKNIRELQVTLKNLREELDFEKRRIVLDAKYRKIARKGLLIHTERILTLLKE